MTDIKEIEAALEELDALQKKYGACCSLGRLDQHAPDWLRYLLKEIERLTAQVRELEGFISALAKEG